MSDSDAPNCGSGGGADSYFGLRVASIFIIMAGSMFGALFPVLAKRSRWLHVPKPVFEFAKFFGSGVIIATAFIHLLDPALDELGSECLSPSWQEYPYALALCLISIFAIFIVELFAFRFGTARLEKLGIQHDAHGHGLGSHAAHGPEGAGRTVDDNEKIDEEAIAEGAGEIEKSELKAAQKGDALDSPAAQIIGIAILEFGIVLHSILVGLTLAVDPDFKVLFVVLVFHQLFEGLGLGSRLAFMRLPASHNHIPIIGGVLYGITTPIGIAAGLGVRTTYNPDSTTASIVSGVMDSISAGILIYTGLVELLAHEFLFSRDMAKASNAKVLYALTCMCLGCGLMALLGKWA